ncbi:nuclear transport factor 2 family protein [Rhodococcus rhodnii]|uniref:SnoaL-like domain-containing protein n=2 Tax=Rhodococcus rhodnii TaxID=38312 RepID=R7WNM3_9NOCA|nr:nuclear transport factor 2 family protein [Rhodococcus rhodnii]EOM76870.1 hypothetical protein Rrhod_1783 [Rhodococcus rhodnii LMG 5362]TXG89763.1 nuclear transport factor 2 family protein [Rhodococcus rhodnii]
MTVDALPDSTAAERGPRVADEWDCVQTTLRFTAALDEGDTETMKSLFVADGRWRRPSGAVEGHDGIDGFVASIPAGTLMRHIVTNARAEVTGDCARVRSYFTVYLSAPDTRSDAAIPTAIGRYDDRLVRGVDGWLIAERDVVFDFAG